MSDHDSRLPPRAEALLSAFGLPERDFDALEARIRAQVAETTIGSTPSALLEAPLPDAADEAAPQESPAKLADLARAVAQKRADLSDAELARETLSVASQLRSQTDVLLERMRAAPRSAEPPLRPRLGAAPDQSVAARPVPAAAPAPSAETAPAAPRSAAPPRSTQRGTSSRTAALFGGAGLVFAAAATVALFLREPPAHAPELEPAGNAVTAAARPAPSVAEPGAPGLDAPPVRNEPVASPPRALAAAPAEPERDAPSEAAAREDAPATTPRPSKPASALASRARAARDVRPEKVVLDESKSGAASEPSAEAELKPAAGAAAPSSMPDRPSTGAVQAAIASVMTSARSCVAGAPDATSATVIFGSNGSVKSVVVSGATQGTPAGKCIQSALGRAKVAPFAQDAFSVGVSVRP